LNYFFGAGIYTLMAEIAVRDPSLDYAPVASAYTNYKFTQFLPDQGTTNATITAGQETMVSVTIPANTAHNPSESFVEFGLQVPAAAITATYTGWIFSEGVPFFSRIYVGDLNTVYAAKIDFANYYMAETVLANTSIEEMKSMDKPDTANGGLFEGITDGERYSSVTVNPANAGAIVFTRPNGNAYQLPMTEPKLAIPAIANGVAAVNTVMNMTVRIKFSLFKDTFLGVDKDIYHGQPIRYTFYFAPRDTIAWRTVNAPADAYSTQPNTGATSLVAGQTINITNFRLQAAVCDPATTMVLRSRYEAGGISYNIPYITGVSNGIAGGAPSNVIVPISGQWGQKLQRIYSAPFLSGGLANMTFDHSNSDAKVTSYNTYLDGQPLQNGPIDVTAFRDYMLMKRFLQGSCLASSAILDSRWVHIEDFGDKPAPLDMPVYPPYENRLRGEDLTANVQRTWSLQSFNTYANALTWYTFVITQRTITFSPAGIVLV
jgi:hypothetical protein